MSEDRHLRGRLDERDRGLGRLRTTTRWLTVGATALAGVFAGLAAEKASGHKAAAPTATTTTQTTVPALPSLPSGGSVQVTPAAPAQAPVQSSSPPVAASGGS